MGKITIRGVKEPELPSLASIYQSAFPKHNIFQRNKKEILEYLHKTQRKYKAAGGGYLVAVAGDKIVGGMLVRKEAEDISGKHALWRLNHLAVLPAYQKKGIGTALLRSGEESIKKVMKEKKMRTAKIEFGVAENEKIAVNFYLNVGYAIEGELRSHYRFNEMVYVMGKEMRL